MSGARGVGTPTIRPGLSPARIERDVFRAIRRHLAGRGDLSPTEREAAARAATGAVLARLRRGETQL